jgi:putative hydrolase of the HAD superfamily
MTQHEANGTPVKIPGGLDEVDVWLFDLDNTLYPASCRLFDEISQRILAYVQAALDLDAAAATDLRQRYCREHGTTLRGLMTLHDVDPDDYLDYVHRIDLSPIEAAPELAAALDSLPGRKIIFTNASRDHVDRVLDRLGINGHFAAVFDVVAADYLPKPHPEPYRRLLDEQRIAPGRAIFVDDMAVNLAPAHALGITTVWLEHETNRRDPGAARAEFIHHRIDDLVGWLSGLERNGLRR